MRAVLEVRYSRRIEASIGRAHVKFGRRFRHARPLIWVLYCRGNSAHGVVVGVAVEGRGRQKNRKK